MKNPRRAFDKKLQSTEDADRPTVLINARLIDPATGRDEPGGLLMRDGKIADLGPQLRRNAPEGATVIDCANQVVCPGLIDMQVFTGEPGAEHRETLRTASHAAAAGGVTTIICMPNTDPVIDDVALVDYIERRARDRALVHVRTMAALTKGLKGQEMTEIGLLQRAGAVAFTNGKSSVSSARVMRNALAYARDFDALVVHYTEDATLAEAGVMNEGEAASHMGLPGIPKAAETLVLERDLRLVGITGARYHAPLISCAESLDVVRAAKARKLAVTCGVSVNHLTLCDADVAPWRSFFKLRPPLRGEPDRVAMVSGIANGTIDVIVSSHDPQGADVKRQPFAEAIDGAIGLETLLSATLRLYHSKQIALLPLLKALTANPAAILGLPAGKLEKGAPADVIQVDLDAHWIVDKEKILSRARNTPFDEVALQGRVQRTFVAGRCVYAQGEIVDG
jgi:dihydroorotase